MGSYGNQLRNLNRAGVLKPGPKGIVSNKTKNGVVDLLIGLMQYFGWTYEEVKSLPIPTLLIIGKSISSQNKDGTGVPSPMEMKTFR